MKFVSSKNGGYAGGKIRSEEKKNKKNTKLPLYLYLIKLIKNMLSC